MGAGEQNGAKHKVFLLPRGDALVHDLNLTAQERAQNNRVRVNKSSLFQTSSTTWSIYSRIISAGIKTLRGRGGRRALRTVQWSLLSDPESSIIV